MLIISKTHETNVALVFNAQRELNGLTAEISLDGWSSPLVLQKLLSLQNIAFQPQDFQNLETGIRRVGTIAIKKADGAILKKQELAYMIVNGAVSISGGQRIDCTVPVVINDPLQNATFLVVTSISKLGEELAQTAPVGSKFVSATFTDTNGNVFSAQLAKVDGKDKWSVTIANGGEDVPPVSQPAKGCDGAGGAPLAAPAEPAADCAESSANQKPGLKSRIKGLFKKRGRRS